MLEQNKQHWPQNCNTLNYIREKDFDCILKVAQCGKQGNNKLQSLTCIWVQLYYHTCENKS